MGRLYCGRNGILEGLREHPLLSRRQLELYLHYSSAGVRYGLRQLRAQQLIWRVNVRQPRMPTRALYALTRAGIEELARQARIPLGDYDKGPRLSPGRLNRMILAIGRVFQLRTFFLWVSHGTSKRAKASPTGLPTTTAAAKGARANATPNRIGLWHAVTWDVEVGKVFSAKGKAVQIPFHGAALFMRGSERRRVESKNTVPSHSRDTAPSQPRETVLSGSKDTALSNSKDSVPSGSREGRWAFVVVEFDTGRAPVAGERKRLGDFVAAQDDPRFWGKDKEANFPVFLVIAQDELRLQDYYTVLRSAAISRHLPMPRAYLTTTRAILSLRGDPTSPVWYSTQSGNRVSLLFDTEGSPGPLPTQVPWRKLPLGEPTGKKAEEKKKNGTLAAPMPQHGRSVEISQAQREGVNCLSELAQISLRLTPLAKLILDEIAAHPLLTRDELALLLKVTLRWVKPALAEMSELELIQVHESRYLVAPKGVQYLTQSAGYGNAVRRYTRVRGWGNGFDTLVRHWEHTKGENGFFLHLARVAQRRHHRLAWLSELEGRLYYEAGQRWHSFLPDGRGTYFAWKQRYEFALEIDRSRAPFVRLRGKLAEYDACISSNVLHSEGIEFLRVLVVTNSWERAETWRRAVLDTKIHFPVFITTFDRLEASGVDSPMWLRGDVASTEPATTSPKECCFECFVE